MGRPQLQPLPFPQLTRLQLWRCNFNITDIGVMVSGLQQMEVLQVLNYSKPTAELCDAHALLKLPRLRVVNLSGVHLWEHEGHSVSVAEQLQMLQKAAPHIDWVLCSNTGSND
jgi:hypothetical protein